MRRTTALLAALLVVVSMIAPAIGAGADDTVTFDGEVVLTGDPASDGSTLRYDLRDATAAGDPTVTFTGRLSAAWDNVTGAGLTDGDTLDLAIAGNRQPTGPGGAPTVTFAGAGYRRWDNRTAADLTDGSTRTVVVDGNVPPTGPGGNTTDPQLELSGVAANVSEYNGSATDDALVGITHDGYHRRSELQVSNATGFDAISGVWLRLAPSVAASAPTINVTVTDETPDGNYTDGEQVVTDRQLSSDALDGGWYYLAFDATYQATGEPTNLTLNFRANTADTSSDSVVRLYHDGSGSGKFEGSFAGAVGVPSVKLVHPASNVTVTGPNGSVSVDTLDGNVTRRIDLPAGSSDLDVALDVGRVDWTLRLRERQATDDPGIDVDGDGSDEGSHTGRLWPDDNVTVEVSAISLANDTGTITTTRGPVDVTVAIRERVETEDPAVEINGHWLNVSGSLADGVTATVNGSASWIRSGTNRVNVTVAPGLSGDAPTPMVGLEYTHATADNQSVSYQAETWSERYNVSRTWGDGGTDATLTIPFASDRVVGVRSVEQRINGSAWTAVDPSNYQLDGTTLTVEFGDVAPNTTTEVRATGSKVNVVKGGIEVTDPARPGEDMDTALRITGVDGDAGVVVEVNSTGAGSWVHYTHDASYPAASFTRHTAAGGQELHLPDASVDDSVRVSTIKLEAAPKDGYVDVRVTDPGTEPEFRVLDSSSTSQVTYRYHDVRTGDTWRLWSRDRDIEVDRDTAESPVVFTHDGSAELLAITKVSTGGGAPGGVAGPVTTGSNGALDWLGASGLIVAVVVALGGLWWVGRRAGMRISGRYVGAGAALVVVLVVVQTVAPWVLGQLVHGLTSSGAPTMLGVVAALGALWWLARAMGRDLSGRTVGGIGAVLIGLLAIQNQAPVAVGQQLAGGLADAMPLIALMVGVSLLVWLWRSQTVVKVLGGGKDA